MKIRWAYFILISLFITQCAKQTAPTGGPKDETPPKLKTSLPKDQQTNFTGTQIELFFDEPIQLNNAREEILITPNAGKKFDVTYNKNRVTLKLENRLKENTTYNINFREAILDMTEKNPAQEKIAFSTGSYIDSLSINGKISDALTGKQPKNYTVALAEVSDTFNIFKHPASWVTVTNKTGRFSIENLKPGKYFLYAFDDKSKNLLVDSKSETYGFIGQPITLEKNIDSVNIRTFKLDVNPLRLITARTTFAYFNLRFSKSLTDFTITAIDTTTKVYSSLESDLTTIKLYNTIPNLDSLQIRVRATDSLNFTVDTLVYMKFPKKEATKDKLSLVIEPATANENNSTLSTSISFSKPITQFIPDSMFVEIDSVTRLPFLEKEYVWNKNRTKLQLTKKIDLNILFPPDTSSLQQKPKKTESRPAKKVASIVFSSGTFVSIEKDSTILLTSPIKLIKLESTAILETKVETSENFIIQLLSKNEKLVDQRVNQKEASFENLPPDIYLLRLIIDLNKNGKWDAGNYSTKTEPEPIVYYRNPKGIKEISLKANWHLGPLLITY